MSSRSTVFVGAVGLALVASLVVSPPPSATAAAPDPAPGRLAFSDQGDAIAEVGLDLVEPEGGDDYLVPVGGASPVEVAGAHSGQARGDVGYWQQGTDSYAFVSTRPTGAGSADDPEGEVWYRHTPLGSDPAYTQVTDDDARESHPEAWVDSLDCLYGSARVDVAFASDRSGNWDIWVARLGADQQDSSGTCGPFEVLEVHQVTDDPADDLWPAWDWDSPNETRSLVFSSTRSDPRGDLYRVEVQPGALADGAAPADLPLTQLTSGPEADASPDPRPRTEYTQPCPGDPGGGQVEPRWLAFSRADDDDPRGGLAVLDLDDPGGGVLSLGVPASSEPDWSPDGRFVAYRSTAEDPDGDVLVGRFERTCPPDLAVASVTLSNTQVPLDVPLSVTVSVENRGRAPASGELVVEFPSVLQNPAGCIDRVCTLDVPTLQAGESVDFAWDVFEGPPPPGVTLVGDPPVADQLGPGEVIATVAVDGPVADAVPDNDTSSAGFTVVQQIDVQFASDPDNADGVTAVPTLLPFTGTDATLDTEVRARVLNPGPVPVDVVLTVESDDPSAVSGGSQQVTRELTVDPNDFSTALVEVFTFTVTRPAANTNPTITFSASLTVVPPVVDPDPSNNSGVATVDLSYIVILAVPDGSLRITDGLYRGPDGATVMPASLDSGARASVVPAGAAPLAAFVPAEVPAPTKPEVEDSVSLAEITAISADFGVAESHPTFTREPTGEQLRLLVTRRPADSRVSDVLSADGTDRRVIAEDSGGRFTMGHPSYSPDGRFVAYHRSTCDRQAPPVSLPAVPGCLVEGSEIVVAAADGSDPVVVEPATQPRPEGARDINPAWSPDGTAVAFTRIEPPAASGGPEAPSTRAIWVARGLDLAAEPADLVADSVAQLTTPNRAVIEDGEVDELDDEAAWSPDSSRVAFTRARFDTGIFDGEPRPLDAGSYDSDIWVVDVSTGDEQPLLAAEVGADQDDELCPESPRTDAAGTVCAGGDDRGADWSPDGTKVVYEHTGWLYLADPDARTDLGPLTGPRVLDPSPSLPLYPDDPADPPVDATDPTSAAFPDLDWAQDPAWSPNGDRVAFAGQPRGHPDQRGIHWLTVPSDPADREIRQVAEQPQPEIEPDWQPTADLAITLTAVPASVEVGSQSQVTATITNEGPGRAIAAVAALTMPAGLTPGALPAGCAAAGSVITCSLGDMADAATVTVTVPVSGPAEGTYPIAGETRSRTVDPDPADNTASASVTLTPQPTADLAITLTAVPATVTAGVSTEVSQVTATITNLGPGQATGASVELTVPVGLTPGALPAGCTAGPPITCALGDLAASATVTVTVPVTGAAAGTYVITAKTSSLTVDPDASNNTATASLVVTPPAEEADLSITIEIDPVPGYVGGEQTVTLTMENVGPLPSTATVVVELPEGSGAPDDEECVTAAGCAIAEIAPQGEVTRTITLTPEAALSGRATATITGPFTDPDPSDNRDRTRIRVLQPAIAFTPSLGTLGRVSMLVGVDFPPDGRVGLKWDEGLLNFRVPVRVRDDGTFQVPILALRRDRLGPRRMTAARVEGELFGEVFADYLVVPRTQFPPDFNGRG